MRIVTIILVNRTDPDGNDDYFNEDGIFLNSTKTGSNIYIDNKLLSKYKFNNKNAYKLAKIGQHYTEKLKLDIAKLKNKDFSVASKERDGNWYSSKSIYNGGTVGMSDMMNCDDKNMTITFSLTDGYIDDLLSNANNMTSTIYHEFDHLNYKDNNGSEHLYVYYNQMRHPSFKNTTQEFKDNAYNSVKDLVNGMSVYNITSPKDWNSWTPEQRKVFKQQINSWKQKFTELGVKF